MTAKGPAYEKEIPVRVNVQMPSRLRRGLDAKASEIQISVPELIRVLLRQGLAQLEKEELERQLAAGYEYLAGGDQALLEEFSAVDLEGWEEW